MSTAKKVDKKLTSALLRLQVRINRDPLSVTDEDIMDVVQPLPEDMWETALLGLNHLRIECTRRETAKFVKN